MSTSAAHLNLSLDSDTDSARYPASLLASSSALPTSAPLTCPNWRRAPFPTPPERLLPGLSLPTSRPSSSTGMFTLYPPLLFPLPKLTPSSQSFVADSTRRSSSALFLAVTWCTLSTSGSRSSRVDSRVRRRSSSRSTSPQRTGSQQLASTHRCVPPLFLTTCTTAVADAILDFSLSSSSAPDLLLE